MTKLRLIMNAARRMEALFPGFFPEVKHNHYADFGYPTTLEFSQFYAMYLRNSLARAAVDRTILKTWQTRPFIAESEKPAETEAEKQIAAAFSRLRLWQRFADADRMGMVGGYGGLILRLADNQRFREPVQRVTGGLDGLVDVIPAWAGQLTVAEWDTDEASPNYGKPKMYQFNESQLHSQKTTGGMRILDVHPDRVVIVSRDGSVNARSTLEPGFNDLLTMEKVSGAGGEGFWKNAKSAPVLEIDKEASLSDMASAMGVEASAVADAMNEQVADWQKGFDKLLMLQGMQAKTLAITLPSPEHFFNIALQSFAASVQMPIKILVGNQTGERASTEDARDWAQTCMARRSDSIGPAILEMMARLGRFGVVKPKAWNLVWDDLTDSTPAEKIERAEKMDRMSQGLEPRFTTDEIREAAGYAPLDDSNQSNDGGDL